MRRSVIGLVLLLGCGASRLEPDAVAPKKPSPAPSARPTSPGEPAAKLPACTPDPRGEKPSASLASRQKAVEALSKGNNQEGLASLVEALRQRPTDLAAFTFHAAAEAERNVQREALTKRAERMKPEALPAVAPPQKTLARFEGAPKPGAVTLKRLSEERHNSDFYAFLERNKLPNPFLSPKSADVLARLPESIGDLGMGAVRYFEGHTLVDYGPAVLLIADDGGAVRSLSFLDPLTEGFKAVLKPPTPPSVPADVPAQVPPSIQVDPTSINAHIRYAQVLGSLLVVELGHDGDGFAARPDGFLLGYDLLTDKVAWVSDAATGTAYNFHASGGYIVAAYSKTTDEERRAARAAYTKPPPGDAKLVVLDAATGKTVATAPLSGRADYVFGTKDRLYAWGDESYETFEITAAAASPKVELGSLTKLEGGSSSIPIGDSTRCWLTNAAVALDHRDAGALLSLAQVLPAGASLTKGLQAAGEFFEERAAGRPGIDLTEAEPILVRPLGTPKVKSGGASVATRRFVPAKESELYYPNPGLELKKGETRPQFVVNVYPNGPSHLYPPAFGLEGIIWAARRDDAVVLAYGSRFVVSLRNDAIEKVFDFSPFGQVDPTATDSRPLAFMTYLDDYLLVVNNPPSHDPKASAAFISAIDPKSGETVWRTEAGVLARQPLIFQDHIVALVNRGSASELVAFRRVDGQPAVRLSFPEVATDIGWDGRGAIFVTLPKERKYFTFR